MVLYEQGSLGSAQYDLFRLSGEKGTLWHVQRFQKLLCL